MRYAKRTSGIYPAAFILLIIVLLSFLGLDYLQAIKDKSQSIFFSRLLKETSPLSSWIDQELIDFIQLHGESAAKIIKIADKPLKKLLVEISEEAYENLAPKLKDRIIALGNESEIKVVEESQNIKTHDWLLRKEGIEEAIFRFEIIKSKPAQPFPVPEPIPPPLASKKKPREKMIAIIMDDLGDNLEAIKTIIDLSRPVNVAILPFAPYSRETAELAIGHGLEVMLHLPLESISSENNNGGKMIEITSRMNEDQIVMFLKECFESLPEVKGVNNHMGSLITQKKEIMKIILAEIKSRGLFFIDSRTTDKSIAYRLAREMALPSDQRDIFLDSEVTEGFILKQVHQLIRLCEKKNKAIAIGHPYPETLRILPKVMDIIEREGIKIVPVSRIIKPD